VPGDRDNKSGDGYRAGPAGGTSSAPSSGATTRYSSPGWLKTGDTNLAAGRSNRQPTMPFHRAHELGKLGFVAVMLMISAARAHDWYPPECCQKVDCAPVERAETLSDGSLRLTSNIGTALVPSSFPRRESPDDQMHICMTRFSHFDDMRPVCLFVPPAAVQPPS